MLRHILIQGVERLIKGMNLEANKMTEWSYSCIPQEGQVKNTKRKLRGSLAPSLRFFSYTFSIGFTPESLAGQE